MAQHRFIALIADMVKSNVCTVRRWLSITDTVGEQVEEPKYVVIKNNFPIVVNMEGIPSKPIEYETYTVTIRFDDHVD